MKFQKFEGGYIVIKGLGKINQFKGGLCLTLQFLFISLTVKFVIGLYI